MSEPSRGLFRRPGIALGVGAAVAGVAGVAFGAQRLASRVGRRPEQEPDLLSPFDEEWNLPAPDGGTIRVISRGSGRPLVLVHGVTLTSDIWIHQLEALPEQGYRVVAFDQRGHGGSTLGHQVQSLEALTDDLRVVLEALELHDVLLVGHSMGGMVTLRYVTEEPEAVAERVRALVLVSTTARTMPFVPSRLRSVLRGAAQRGPLVTAPLGIPNVGHAITRTGFGRGAKASDVELARRLIQATDPSTVRAATQWLVDVDLTEALAEVTLPTLVVCGSADILTPPGESRRLARAIADSRLVVMKGVGHTLMLERAEEFDALLVEFDAELEAAAVRTEDDAVPADVPLGWTREVGA